MDSIQIPQGRRVHVCGLAEYEPSRCRYLDANPEANVSGVPLTGEHQPPEIFRDRRSVPASVPGRAGGNSHCQAISTAEGRDALWGLPLPRPR